MAISFSPMNRPVGTDSPDMPHVLGDAADTLWQGHAERVDTNLNTINGFAQTMKDAGKPIAELSGSAVFTPATGFTLTGGWAYGRSCTFINGVKLVTIDIRALYTGPDIYWTGDGGGFEHVASISIGTLATALRPTMTNFYWRWCAQFAATNPQYPGYYSCDVGLVTSGALTLYRTSNDHSTFLNTTYITFSGEYFTAPS